MSDLSFTLQLLAGVVAGLVAIGLAGGGLIAAVVWLVDRWERKREET